VTAAPSATAESADLRRWRLHLSLIVVLRATSFFALGFNSGFLPYYIQQDLHVDDPSAVKFLVGVTASASPLMIMICNPFWGVLADRLGQKPMLLRAMVGTGICLALPAFIDQPWEFVVSRLLLGVFTGINAATMGMVSMLVPRERLATSLGWIQTTRYIGMSSGPAVGGFLADRIGFDNTYLLAAAISIGMGAIAWIALPGASGESKSGPTMSMVDRFRYIGTQKQILLLLVFIFLVQLIDFVVVPYIPLVVEAVATNRDHLATISGLVVSAGSLSISLAGVMMGRVAGRWGYVRPMIVACVGGCACQCLFAVAQSPEQLFALRFLMGLAYGSLLPLATAATGLWTPGQHRGLVFGVVSTANPAAGVAGPLVGTLFAAPLGSRAPFFAAGLLLVGAATLAWRSLTEPPKVDSPARA
jgi:DHA1 family multidrug resistance protein-like MFS transporter